MGRNFPGQSSGLCGQAIQVAAWGAHSAGMRVAGTVIGAGGILCYRVPPRPVKVCEELVEVAYGNCSAVTSISRRWVVPGRSTEPIIRGLPGGTNRTLFRDVCLMMGSSGPTPDFSSATLN